MVKYKTGDALKQGIALLNENKIENAGLDARVLLCHVLNCDSLYLTLHRDEELDESDEELEDEPDDADEPLPASFTSALILSAASLTFF